MEQTDERLYRIALTMLPNVGAVLAKNLVAYCGSAEGVFKASKAKLEKIPLIGPERAESIVKADVLHAAEKEIKFIDANHIQVLFFTDKDYPQRLKDLNDSPALLYYKGNANLNAEKIVGVVGTRRISEYGKDVTRKLVAGLVANEVLVISGLAFGADTVAHQAALDNGLNTVGVLGHGLHTIYPQQNAALAKKMVECGGVLSEYTSADEMTPHNFPERNRIVAGMCDALVVTESAKDGGAVITANIANTYNKDVFAIPGRSIDKMSTGCNHLIKSNKASLIENAADLIAAMRWNDAVAPKAKTAQRTLAINLTGEEQKIYTTLNEKGEVEIDTLSLSTGLNAGTLAATLLEMEMNNLVISLPGKRYKLT